jgi:beta-ureidopropionase / N-carbamoyl-L-amino-acid hydrolase
MHTLKNHVLALHPQATTLFDDLRAGSVDLVNRGVTRDTYGQGEQFAHELVEKHARALGLEIRHDSMRNTYMVWPGLDRQAPALVIGSHLDSVLGGGNFDGAAGVMAGLIAVQALQQAGLQLNCDVVVMGIRAEESIWFQVSYVGSRGALGTLPASALQQRRIDTGRTLEQHMREAGADPEAVAKGVAYLSPKNVKAFLELHIEQAPSLALTGYPLAIGTGVPGHFRYPRVKITGEYGHVGLGRRFRHDAALAGADLSVALDALWQQWEAAGRLMACTFGEFQTNPARHGMTIVPGEFQFSLDVRAYDDADIAELERALTAMVTDIEVKRGVKFDFGVRASAKVAKADSAITQQLRDCAAQLALKICDLPSPASHDSAAFCAVGIPFGFIFIRNPNGSHHPDEAMSIDDFLQGTALLTEWLATHGDKL